MSDSFLEEQVRRIRQLAEGMEQVDKERHRFDEARDRLGSGHRPLDDVRVFESPKSDRAVARDSSSPRRRRRR